MPEITARRHDLLWVDPKAWSAFVISRADLRGLPLVHEWAAMRRPLVRRRPDVPTTDDLELGLPLPPEQGKLRLTFAVPTTAVVATFRPHYLRTAAAAAPSAWRDTIAAIVDLDPEVRCYGSLAWQYMTDLPYLAAQSDLDLLWMVRSPAEADALGSRLLEISRSAPMRIDGELVSPSGGGVQWREWRCGQDEVLVRRLDGIGLINRQSVFA